ncbi:MAG: glycoside hydrolase family 130 protein [Clostridia bacterium]|nr:glycoside hydrolase family 130 protein [Clostridia bacterium]
MPKIIGNALPNIPWQEKPAGYRYPVWRYDGNPIITRDDLFEANSIFNSAVVPYKGGFAGVFRVDTITRDHTLVVGYSDDAIRWRLEEKVIFRGYDPRLCEIDGKYYLSWVNLTPHGTTIGIAYTTDFETWTQLEDACYPVARNGVLFPRKIRDEYVLLIRPCDRGHTPYGDIFLQQSPDLTYWGKYRFVMQPVKNWESTKIGAGPTPIETDEGWLLFYHGVLTSCNGFTYAMGAAILDRDEPWKVLHRADSFLLAPHRDYEYVGDVPNVVFPCAALTDAETGRIAIYYGGADTVVALAFTTVDETVKFIKEHDLPNRS